MTAARDVYCFVRITPANYLYALWLSLRAPVAAWKIEVPAALAGRFERVRPYRLFTRDEWLLAHDLAFDLWKARALPRISERHRVSAEIGGHPVDFSRNAWQIHGIEFEALSLFVSMLTKMPQAASMRVVEPWIARAFERGELERIFPGVSFARSAIHRMLEGLREWGVSAAHLGRALARAARSLLRPQRRIGRRPIVWLGISPAEMADTDDRLNFAWAAQYGYVAASDVVYALPCTPTRAQRAYFESHGLAAIEPQAEFELLPMRARIAVAARSIAGVGRALFMPAATAALAARFMARAPYWMRLFAELGTTAYVTSASYSWPEKPEVSAATALDLRTIMWTYSANTPVFSVQAPDFRDLGVYRSALITAEYWAWNRANEQWLRNRQVLPGLSTIRITGPLMCGNPALLALDRAAARARLALPEEGLCLGIFDLPPMNDAWRDRYGGGPPLVSLESYVGFWDAIHRILERIPKAFALIKLKRDFTHPYRELPAVLRAMVDEQSPLKRSGRVHLIESEIDPYLPIAASDVAIGVPYTSPILAARTIGRPAFYLDPLGLANFPSCAEYQALTVVSENEAVEIVRDALQGANRFTEVALEALTPPQPSFPLVARADQPAGATTSGDPKQVAS